MVKEAEANAEEDKKRREEPRSATRPIPLSDDVSKEVTDKVNELKEALKGEDVEKIKSAQEALMTSAQKIGQALYAQQGAADAAGTGAAGAADAGAAGAAGAGAGSAASSDDDVVDAEVVDDDDKDNK
jgi:molecular chaperone DnaK